MPKASRPARQMRQTSVEHRDPLDILTEAEELRERIPVDLVLRMLEQVGQEAAGWKRCPTCSAPHTGPRFCSRVCMHRYFAGRNTAKRRAQKKGADQAEDIDLAQLAKRDGFICHICKGRVLPPDASIDHLIPLSKGGQHIWANVALAHGRCNSRRGAGRLPAQLRLE